MNEHEEKQKTEIINNQIRNFKKCLGTDKCFDINECIARVKCSDSMKCVPKNDINASQPKGKLRNAEKLTAYHKFIQTVIENTRPSTKLLSQGIWVNKY